VESGAQIDEASASNRRYNASMVRARAAFEHTSCTRRQPLSAIERIESIEGVIKVTGTDGADINVSI
jgi:hypothetical protein